MSGSGKPISEQAQDALNAASNKAAETWDAAKNKASEVSYDTR